MNREHIVGPITIRTCEGPRGHRLPGHAHEFAHVTFARNGWILIRTPDAEVQIASPEYRHDGSPGFAPVGYWHLIPAMVNHEIIVLSEYGALDCVFTHRNYAGNVVQEPDWGVANMAV